MTATTQFKIDDNKKKILRVRNIFFFCVIFTVVTLLSIRIIKTVITDRLRKTGHTDSESRVSYYRLAAIEVAKLTNENVEEKSKKRERPCVSCIVGNSKSAVFFSSCFSVDIFF